MSQSYGAKATFFMTGNNLGKGMINDPTSIYPAIIRVGNTSFPPFPVYSLTDVYRGCMQKAIKSPVTRGLTRTPAS